MRSCISVDEDRLSRISNAIGVEIVRCEALSGGSLSTVYRVETKDGRCIIAKMAVGVEREARMLRAIAKTGCPAPETVYVADGLLVMTDVTAGDGGYRGWADAGSAIRVLHDQQGVEYGWHEPSAFGSVSCPSAPSDNWPMFWAERRLLAWPDALPADIGRRVEDLAARLDDFVPAFPRPSLLHGDLWGGNIVFDGRRFAGVIDPACYYGHNEVDLAMLTLFGAPGGAFWETYGPLDPGWQERRALYQLWLALVHLRLFGGGYRGMVDRLLAQYGA